MIWVHVCYIALLLCMFIFSDKKTASHSEEYYCDILTEINAGKVK